MDCEPRDRGAETSGPAGRPADVPLSILVADDTAASRKLLYHILDQRGHRVTSVADGREAMKYFRGGGFDVVFLDVYMPLMDGCQTIEAIRKHEQTSLGRSRIIVLTSHADDAHRRQCLAAGADAYATKPIDAERIIRLAERLEGCSGNRPDPPPAAGQALPDRSQSEGPPVIDLEGSLQRLGGDMELLREFVRVFDEDSPALMDQLREGVRDRNASAIERAAHSLKGLASNFGAQAAVAAAASMEEIGVHSLWEDADRALAEMEREVSRQNAALDVLRRRW